MMPGKPLPFIDRAIFSLEKEDIPYWNKFLQGYYDTSGISSDSFDQAIRVGAGGEASADRGDARTGHRAADRRCHLDLLHRLQHAGPGGRRLFRAGRASCARRSPSPSISRNTSRFFCNGRGIPAQSPIPPGIFGFVEGAAGFNSDVYDLDAGMVRDASRSRSRAACWPRPVIPRVATPTPASRWCSISTPRPPGPTTRRGSTGCTSSSRNWTYSSSCAAPTTTASRRRCARARRRSIQWGWNADYPDPENFLFLLYGPNGKVEHGGENASNYDNPEFDRLFDHMKNMENGPQRQAIIDRMVAIARRDKPWLWGYHPKDFGLYHALVPATSNPT